MNDSGRGERPEYKVYRSRRGGLMRGSGDLSRLVERSRKRTDRAPRQGKPINPGRVFKWVALTVAGWIAVSVVLFLASAQLQEGTAEGTEEALSGGGNLLTGSTVLVLGSDARIGDSIDRSQRGPSRADSIMVMRAGFGSVRKLSIPRDAYAEIPGHTGQKINAAYALGGAGLMVKTVERFFGNDLRVNHVVEVDFNDFPALIDTLGGITVTSKSRICSPPFDNFYKGYNLPKGDVEVDGREALGFARVRKNNCAPSENDLDRAERQQEVVSGIRDKLLSPTAFIRLPWISWQAPKTLETDMAGVGLMTLFIDLTTGNQRKTNVLRPSCLGCGPGSSILVSEAERQTAVERLLGK